METSWNNFINEYKDFLYTKSLSQILEAYFYYNSSFKTKAGEITGKYIMEPVIEKKVLYKQITVECYG